MVKQKTPKTSNSRPPSTSALSQPLLPSSVSASIESACSSFSPGSRHLFAHLSKHVHQQRLKIYDSSTSASSRQQLVTDYALDEASNCLSLHWISVSVSSSSETGASEVQSASKSPSSKRRKQTSDKQSELPFMETPGTLLLALGLADGRIQLLSPTQAKLIATLDGCSSDVATGPSIPGGVGIVSLTSSHTAEATTLLACSLSGLVSSFTIRSIVPGDAPIKPEFTFRPDTKVATNMIASPAHTVNQRLLAAHHSIHLLGLETGASRTVATYTGHASPITHILWLNDKVFLTAAEGDRIVYLWSTAEAPLGAKPITGRPVATLALDSAVRCAAVTASDEEPKILIVSQSGEVGIYGLPSTDQKTPTQGSGRKAKSSSLPSLTKLCQMEATTGSDSLWLDVCFVPSAAGETDKIRLARLIKGAKVLIDEVALLDAQTGQLKRKITLSRSVSSIEPFPREGDEGGLTGGINRTQRYVDPPQSGVSRGSTGLTSLDDVGIAGGIAGSGPAQSEGQEPTLAQRLRSLGVRSGVSDNGDSDEEEGADRKRNLISEASLSTSLSQALHSGDSALLSSCLSHTDSALIRATVRKISGPMAVRLLEECVARLNGRGSKGNNGASKGTLGSQRARGITEWCRATMLSHMGYLMSIPNLVTRMASLHSTLSARLSSHERLLALNGRLELVLSQIEMRASYAAEQERRIQVQGVKLKKADKASTAANNLASTSKKWVEASDDEDDGDDDDDNMKPDGGNEGDIQDIALGVGESDSEVAEDDDEAVVLVRRAKKRPASEARKAAGGVLSEDELMEGLEEDDADDDEGEDENDDDDDDEEVDDDDEDDEDEETDLDREGASDEDEDDDDMEDEGGAGGPNGMFDLEAESTDGESEEDVSE
ncbi:NUC189-domain-containing protein [Violaceomyces palustris]|uniref:NUC189-domain-containing protein n=1 Tax=Violaceomyces palustris TaxID=1673888 RepID=A0ACD0P780_9BASI|nr:NUC189-domain-containing protein [Violaceomyces palustris]